MREFSINNRRDTVFCVSAYVCVYVGTLLWTVKNNLIVSLYVGVYVFRGFSEGSGFTFKFQNWLNPKIEFQRSYPTDVLKVPSRFFSSDFVTCGPGPCRDSLLMWRTGVEGRWQHLTIVLFLTYHVKISLLCRFLFLKLREPHR